MTERLNAEESERFAAAQKKFGVSVSFAVASSLAMFGVAYATEAPQWVLFVILAAGWAPFYYVAYFVRRCPRCNKAFGNRPRVDVCTKCGVAMTADG